MIPIVYTNAREQTNYMEKKYRQTHIGRCLAKIKVILKAGVVRSHFHRRSIKMVLF